MAPRSRTPPRVDRGESRRNRMPICILLAVICLCGTHPKGETCSSQMSKASLGPTQPKKPKGPSHPGKPEGGPRRPSRPLEDVYNNTTTTNNNNNNNNNNNISIILLAVDVTVTFALAAESGPSS